MWRLFGKLQGLGRGLFRWRHPRWQQRQQQRQQKAIIDEIERDAPVGSYARGTGTHQKLYNSLKKRIDTTMRRLKVAGAGGSREYAGLRRLAHDVLLAKQWYRSYAGSAIMTIPARRVGSGLFLYDGFYTPCFPPWEESTGHSIPLGHTGELRMSPERFMDGVLLELHALWKRAAAQALPSGSRGANARLSKDAARARDARKARRRAQLARRAQQKKVAR